MKRLLLAFTALFLFVGAASAGHDNHYKGAYDDSYLIEATAKLADDSQRLYRRLKRETGYSPLANEARLLARGSEQLYEDAKYGARPRALQRRFRQLSDCLYGLKDAFYSNQYSYLSHRSHRRLDKVLASFGSVERGLNTRQPREYSYHQPKTRRGAYRR
ncbi:MAG: hypothetical protein Tsb002_37410 [Wenzhouxiangellaceae bacterium]